MTDDFKILQFRGKTGYYLEPAPGEASLSVLKMAREGLALDLRAALHTARRKDAPVRKEGLRVKSNGDVRHVNLTIVPIHSASKERYFLVLFEDVTPPRKRNAGAVETARRARIKVRKSSGFAKN